MKRLRVELGLVQWFPYADVRRVRRVVAKLETLGIKRLRTMLSWADWCRPDGPAWIETLVEELDGLDVLPVLHATPPSFGEKPYSCSVPRDLGTYAYFVQQICRTYRDRFPFVQLWNEPTTWNEWDRDADRWWTRFAEMIRYAAREAADAGVRVVLGGISPPDGHLLRAPSASSPHFLQIMEAEGALADVDVVAFHGFPGTAHWSVGWTSWDDQIDAVATWAGARGLDTWITEVGMSRLSEGSREGQLRDVVRAAAAGGLARVYWYSVEDVDWPALREVNLDWGPDPHDYATGLDASLERLLRAGVAQPVAPGRLKG